MYFEGGRPDLLSCPDDGYTNFALIGLDKSAANRLISNRIPQCQCPNNPKTATPFCVPTYTLPLTIIGVMNLFPFPKLSRPFAA